MVKITVVPPDNVMIVAEVTMYFEFPNPDRVHALQWEGNIGHIEWQGPRGNTALTPEDFESLVQPWLTLWEAEVARRAQPLPPVPPTPEQQLAAFTAAIQARLDAFAHTRNYDGILSACTYATSTVPKFQQEGQYAATARDATWAMSYAIMDAVQKGQRPIPTVEQLAAELPLLNWPGEVPIIN